MNRDALQKLNDGRNLMHFVSGSIHCLADAFESTGNERASEKLRGLARSLEAADDLIKAGTDEAFSEYLRASNEASNNIFRAAMAGVLMPRQADVSGE